MTTARRTPSPTDTTPSELDDFWSRVLERGYVLLSELQQRFDPVSHAPTWVDDTAQDARDQGLQVLDDLAADTDRPDPNAPSASSDSVRQYLNEIGRTQLLTHELEVDLAKRYRAGLAAAELLATASHTRRRTAELELVRRGGEHAKEHMIRANLRLVVSISRSFRGRGVDMLGLFQEGNLGLIRGVEKFDHTKGYKFSTYATWWIRQALQRGLANSGRTVRLPVHVHELVGKIRHSEMNLLQLLGRPPTEEEIADEVGVTVPRLREIRRAALDVASLDRPVGEDGSATMGSLVPDDDAVDPALQAAATLSRVEVVHALAGLSDRERRILMLRYGLADGREHTLQDIGVQLGLTRERIRQIEKKSLTKLRHPSRGAHLRSLLHDDEVAP